VPLERFHAQFKNEALVIDKWFTLQVTAPEHEGKVFARAKTLMQHPDFTLRTPNRAAQSVDGAVPEQPGGLPSSGCRWLCLLG
jgi:aminopeptidase N